MDLKKVQEDLDLISPSMCLVKWKHASINLSAQMVKNCCHTMARKMESNNNPLMIHDNSKDRAVRKALLQGERPKDCSYCWAMEETGSYSDRLHWSAQNWMREFYDEVKSHSSETALSPSWLEVNFSSQCNLKCSYCSPAYSTSWQKEVREHGAYPTHPIYNDLQWFLDEGLIEENQKHSYEASLEKFWTWLPATLPGVRLLTLTGGEPLLDKNNFAIFDYLAKHPQPRLELAINSNLTLPDKIWNRFLDSAEQLLKEKHIKALYLHPSLDSWGERAEYIRSGLDLKLLQKNVESYLKRTTGNLVINCTLNNLSLGGLLDFWKYVVQLKKEYGHNRWISSTTELLLHPTWQRLDLLPLHFMSILEDVEEYLKSEGGLISSHELSGIQRAKNFLSAQSENTKNNLNNFRVFFKEHDRRRKTDFEETFPELRSLFHEDIGDFSIGSRSASPS